MSLTIERIIPIPTQAITDREKTEYDTVPVTDVAFVTVREPISAESSTSKQTVQYLWVTAQSGLHIFAPSTQHLLSLNGAFTLVQQAQDEAGSVLIVRDQRDLFREGPRPWKERDSFSSPAMTLSQQQTDLGDLHSLVSLQEGQKFVVGHRGSSWSLYQCDQESTTLQHHLVWSKQTRMFAAWRVAAAHDGEHCYALNTSGGTQIVCQFNPGDGVITKRQSLQHFASQLAVLPNKGGVVLIINRNNREYVAQLLAHDLRAERVLYKSEEPITAMCTDAESGYLVVGIGRAGRIVQIDVASGSIMAQSEPLHTRIECLDSINGGELIAAGGYNGRAYLISNPNLSDF